MTAVAGRQDALALGVYNDPLSYAAYDHPYEVYRQLRDLAPLYYNRVDADLLRTVPCASSSPIRNEKAHEGASMRRGLLIHPNLVILEGDPARSVAESRKANASGYRVRFDDVARTVLVVAEVHQYGSDDPLVGLTFLMDAPVPPVRLPASKGGAESESVVRAFIAGSESADALGGGDGDTDFRICDLFPGGWFCHKPGRPGGGTV